MRLIVCLLLASVALCSAKVYFKETFDDTWEERWTHSSWKKGSEAGKFEVSAGDFYGDAEEDKGLMTSTDARFYDISTTFEEFTNKDKDLVVQFSVKHQQKIDCGGGYVKVLPAGHDPDKFSGDTDYNIMFGPDICGSSTKKVHVIFNYDGENHLIEKEIACKTDQMTHVYTLIVHPDQTYEVRIDGDKVKSGNLEDDWNMLEPKKIKDPELSKPKDWVDESTMDDPEDTKPEGYDDIPELIPDPDAEKPDDWDDEDDGEWEAPMIDNPDYEGEWEPKKIPNPDYQGKWVHPEIDNPDYVHDPNLYSYESFGGIGIDVWQVKAGTVFDNIIITDDIAEAEEFLEETFTKNKGAEKKAFDQMEKDRRAKEEEERKAREAEEEAEDDDDEEEQDWEDEEDRDL